MRRIAKMLVLAMALTMMFATVAHAASDDTGNVPPSPSTSPSSVSAAYAEGITATSDSGTVVVGTLTEAQINAAQQASVELVAPTAKVLKAFNLDIPGVGAGTIRINVPGVVAGQKIAVLHYNGTAGKWEMVPVNKVENGYVTATFSSLSPVAIVAYNASAKTADSGMSWLAVLAMVCLFGAAVCTRKARQY